jgi:hypothetical protein
LARIANILLGAFVMSLSSAAPASKLVECIVAARVEKTPTATVDASGRPALSVRIAFVRPRVPSPDGRPCEDIYHLPRYFGYGTTVDIRVGTDSGGESLRRGAFARFRYYYAESAGGSGIVAGESWEVLELIDPPDEEADAPIEQHQVIGVVSGSARAHGQLLYVYVKLEDGTVVKARARNGRARSGERVLVSQTSLGSSVSYRVLRYLDEEPTSGR